MLINSKAGKQQPEVLIWGMAHICACRFGKDSAHKQVRCHTFMDLYSLSAKKRGLFLTLWTVGEERREAGSLVRGCVLLRPWAGLASVYSNQASGSADHC